MISIEETNTNLNTRLKFVNLTINDKDSQIKSLQDQLFHQNSQFLDSQSCLEEYKQTSERNLKEVNDMYTRKISEIEESYKVLILDLKTQLSKIQNEAKDANILKIQATKYQQAVEKLQEIVKNLENQSNNNIQKIDKLTLQIEKSQQGLRKKKEKVKNLKIFNLEIQNSFEVQKKEFEIEKEILIKKSKESEMIRQEAETLLQRIETQIKATDSMIDKRIISTFLLNYLSEKNNSKIKNQMLRALAEMLGFNQEQRIKVGLGQDQGIFSHLVGFIGRG